MDISFKNVNYFYNYNSPTETKALNDINLEIPSGSFVSIIGQTGSGKSTLIQHINGLLIPSSGEIRVAGYTINNQTKRKKLAQLRSKVGMVFQFPENQVYESTVIKDIAVAPINFGVDKDSAYEQAKEMLKVVGLSDEVAQRSPFSLSGGQMRRVAIAGILAMHPKILVLDEPTAGLDPHTHEEMMDLFFSLHHEWHLTTIMVSHQMDDVAKYSDQVILMEQGSIIKKGSPREVFTENIPVGVPATIEFCDRLQEKGINLAPAPLTTEELVRELKETLLGT
ncbi:energy-coupling factor transporter ATPase [Xylocopilactobacillus apis]|uniref:Energy-coupling factor transporter ATP-binding protein EcfA2 n=1 Tax=Xylocopilactobacillus apis TaxID=2932183 RepID=A0AAU9DTU9_9LACO|nr:energy-coupling factor transporter ATPase [Xylocopilactobacillus apis]BDR57243.1 energy-coupling factor transporter ATP-binding protein EcfA2 [Xylocopilactobacillus apis]